jgi:hypothetical protein
MSDPIDVSPASLRALAEFEERTRYPGCDTERSLRAAADRIELLERELKSPPTKECACGLCDTYHVGGHFLRVRDEALEDAAKECERNAGPLTGEDAAMAMTRRIRALKGKAGQ